MSATTAKWQKLRGHAGLEFRQYGDTKTWRFRQSVAGRAYTDAFGVLSEEQAILTAAKLREARKIGAGPQSFKDIEEEINEEKRAAKIKEERDRKRQIAEDEFEKANTISKFWANIYWPKRTKKGNSHNPRSNRTIECIFDLWIRPIVGDIPFQELTCLDIEKMLDKMKEKEKSAQTQKHAYAILQAIWNSARIYYSAKRKIDLQVFPGKDVKTEKLNNEKKCWLTKNEAQLLLNTLKKWRKCCAKHGIYCRGGDTEDAYGMAVLSLFSGLRLGDICKLTWGDVENRDTSYARTPKGGKAYGVHLGFGLVKEMIEERRSRLKTPPRPTDLVFRNAKGEKRKEAPKLFKEVIDELGFNYTPRRWGNDLEKIDFHSLRHTFASWLAMQSTNLYTIKKLMGHSSIAMTERYADLDPQLTREPVENLYWNFSGINDAEGKLD